MHDSRVVFVTSEQIYSSFSARLAPQHLTLRAMLQHLYRTTRRTLTLHRTAPSRPLSALFSQSRVVQQISAQQLTDKLRAKFPENELIEVDDARGDGSFFHITVISKQFEGKNLLEQHKMVNSVLKDDMPQIHGVTINTGTKKPRELPSMTK